MKSYTSLIVLAILLVSGLILTIILFDLYSFLIENDDYRNEYIAARMSNEVVYNNYVGIFNGIMLSVLIVCSGAYIFSMCVIQKKKLYIYLAVFWTVFVILMKWGTNYLLG